MKEHTRKQVNVLGIDVSVMRPEKAVNITMNYVNRKELSTIYFHTAGSSVFCQTHDWAAQRIQSSNLVLAGDRYMEEHTVAHAFSGQQNRPGNGLFSYAYLKRLFHRLNRETREIYLIMSREEHLNSMKEYMAEKYPDILVQGDVLGDEPASEQERIVNDINGIIPEIVFVCLPSEQLLKFVDEYQLMMNTRIIICFESLQQLVQSETENVPRLVEILHLDGIYQWIKKEGKIQEQIIGSIFKRSILNKADEDQSSAEEGDDQETKTEQKQEGEE